jgi:hypothetical protein
MGCGGSMSTALTSRGPLTTRQQAKAVFLVFSLPPRARAVFGKIIGEARFCDSFGLRFQDASVQRSSRCYWTHDLQSKDHAGAIYVADVRDRGSLLMNVKTLNWFLKLIYGKENLIVVVIKSREGQVEQFQSLLSCKVELTELAEGKHELIENFQNIISGVMCATEQKKRSWGKP